MINSSDNGGQFCLKLGQLEFVVSATLYGGYMYLKEGWKNFVEDGQLEEGDILFLQTDCGNSKILTCVIAEEENDSMMQGEGKKRSCHSILFKTTLVVSFFLIV